MRRVDRRDGGVDVRRHRAGVLHAFAVLDDAVAPAERRAGVEDALHLGADLADLGRGHAADVDACGAGRLGAGQPRLEVVGVLLVVVEASADQRAALGLELGAECVRDSLAVGLVV